MAEENRELNRRVEEPIQIEVPGTGTDTSNSGPEKTGKRGRPRKSAGTETGTGTGTGTTETEKTELPGMASVDEPPQPKKAKRKRTTKTKNNPTFNAEQITTLIMSTSIILGQSEGGKFFTLSEAEAKQIAEPLANIISKNDAFAGLGEHSDSIALMSACFMIFIPRFIAYLGYRKQKKTLREKNVRIIKGVEPNGQKTESSPNDRRNVKTSTPINSGDGESILSGLPSLA